MMVTAEWTVSIVFFEFQTFNRIFRKSPMDVTREVTKWVEKNLGKVIIKDISEKITKENSPFDVDSYVNDLLDEFFNGDEIENLRESLNDLESDNSRERENNSQDSLEFESQEYQTLTADEIIKNLKNNSIEVRINSLRVLELSAEELINQSSWSTIKKLLQKMLQFKADKKIHSLVLKVFQKFLTSSNKPQLVCEGFIALTEVLSYHIELINADEENISFEEVYDLKKDKWLYKKMSEKSTDDRLPKNRKTIDPDLLIKLMWLLIECQKQMPEKWIRFHQKRLKEIIFSFIHLLSATTLENDKLSGLEIVSVLSPTACWSLHWCHTATGRALLCSALRKYKNFFVHIVEVILRRIKAKKPKQSLSVREGEKTENSELNVSKNEKGQGIAGEKHSEQERSKWVRSAPTASIENSRKSEKSADWLIKSIPRRIVNKAVFFHSACLVTYLIQYRSGRTLFPVQTSTRKRLLSIQDFSHIMIEYLENFEYSDWNRDNVPPTSSYRVKVLEILEILESVKNNPHSSRLSAERPHP